MINLTGCEKQNTPVVPPRPALVMKVGVKKVENSMVLVGEVRPRYEANQGFRINGKIVERLVEVGTHVKKGQVLARLDESDARLSAAAAIADVRSAEARYALAAAELERQKQLYVKKFISAAALDIKETELKTASAFLAQIKATANVTGNQTQYTRLTADRDGVITMMRAEPGQVVTSGEVVATIANLQEIEVLVAVPESRMSDIKQNAAVSIKMWTNQTKSFAGIVREISPAADAATRTFNVRVSMSHPDDSIKLGMTAGVKFSPVTNQKEPQLAQEYATLMIPSSALTAINTQKIVWVINANHQAQPREVSTGQFTEDGVHIINGLQAGEIIAIAGVHTLVKNQYVKPIFAPVK